MMREKGMWMGVGGGEMKNEDSKRYLERQKRCKQLKGRGLQNITYKENRKEMRKGEIGLDRKKLLEMGSGTLNV